MVYSISFYKSGHTLDYPEYSILCLLFNNVGDHTMSNENDWPIVSHWQIVSSKNKQQQKTNNKNSLIAFIDDYPTSIWPQFLRPTLDEDWISCIKAHSRYESTAVLKYYIQMNI